MYELRFMEQFLKGEYEAIQFFLRNFNFIMRYQDDRWSGFSKYLKRALYSDRFWGQHSEDTALITTHMYPWHGVYPACLNINTEQKSMDTVTHQDARIVRWITNPAGTAGGNPTYRFRVQLYVKQSDRAYDKIRKYIIKYCHPDTMLADSAIYGVVYSQTQRFSKRCSWQSEFILAIEDMVGSMIQLGYNSHKVWAQFDKFARKNRDLYGPQSVWKLRSRVREATRNRRNSV